MGRCDNCNAVVKKHDTSCYICGDKIRRPVSFAVNKQKISLASNLLFVASLGFTFYSFYAQEKLSLEVSLAVSATLFLLRLVADRFTRPSDALPR